MIFHKTDHHITPGVCKYDTLKALNDQRPKSPKACIGNAVRFPTNKLKDYVKTTSHAYVASYSRQGRSPIVGGTFGNAIRWKKPDTVTPGVGDYDIQNLIGLA